LQRLKPTESGGDRCSSGVSSSAWIIQASVLPYDAPFCADVAVLRIAFVSNYEMDEKP